MVAPVKNADFIPGAPLLSFQPHIQHTAAIPATGALENAAQGTQLASPAGAPGIIVISVFDAAGIVVIVTLTVIATATATVIATVTVTVIISAVATITAVTTVITAVATITAITIVIRPGGGRLQQHLRRKGDTQQQQQQRLPSGQAFGC